MMFEIVIINNNKRYFESKTLWFKGQQNLDYFFTVTENSYTPFLYNIGKLCLNIE